MNVRNGTTSDGGILNAVCNTAALLANPARRRQNSTCSSFYGTTNAAGVFTPAASTAYTGQRYAFDSTGNLVLSNPLVDFRDLTAGSSTNTIGGLGSTLLNTGEISPQQDRVSVNALAHYDFSPALTVYGEAKYVRIGQRDQSAAAAGAVR